MSGTAQSIAPEEVAESITKKLEACERIERIVIQTHYGSVELPVSEIWHADGTLRISVFQP